MSTNTWSDTTKELPVLFIGHGSPTTVVDDNPFRPAWESFTKTLPKPKAILSISAHWFTKGNKITAMETPRTIYDFYGFPKYMYELKYPAAGSPSLAKLIADNSGGSISLDYEWGFDHGTWCVLKPMYPAADIPVLQLSLDKNASAEEHFKLGQQLRYLRKKGVLIMASGNIVHNLKTVDFSNTKKYSWATEFDAHIWAALERRDFGTVIDYKIGGKKALLSVPTPDHYYPLLVALGAVDKTEKIENITEGICLGSISMRSLCFGEV